MFLLQDEIIDARFSLYQQIVILMLAIIFLCLLFYFTFCQEFVFVLLNPKNEIKDPSDYIGFLLGIANIYVIAKTAFRIFRRLRQIQKIN